MPKVILPSCRVALCRHGSRPCPHSRGLDIPCPRTPAAVTMTLSSPPVPMLQTGCVRWLSKNCLQHLYKLRCRLPNLLKANLEDRTISEVYVAMMKSGETVWADGAFWKRIQTVWIFSLILPACRCVVICNDANGFDLMHLAAPYLVKMQRRHVERLLV